MEQRIEIDPNSPPSEREIVEQAGRAIRAALPRGWAFRDDYRPVSSSDQGKFRSVFRITAPDGSTGELQVEARSIISPKDVPYLLDQMDLWQEEEPKSPLIVARYLSPNTREAIEERNASFVDTTGNVSVSLNRPAILIKTQGTNKDPYRTPERRTSSLKGLPAARVIRALIDCKPPWKMRDLEEVSGTSLASVSRIIDLLDREEMVTRKGRGPVEDVDWEELIRRWADDYRLTEKRSGVGRYLAPRGLDAVVGQLQNSNIEYAVSGTLAAQNWAPYAEATAGLVYVDDLEQFKKNIRVAEGSSTADLIVIEPRDDLPFVRSLRINETKFVAPSQACVDLLTGPGRNPEEGLELLRWMRSNESEWRLDGV